MKSCFLLSVLTAAASVVSQAQTLPRIYPTPQKLELMPIHTDIRSAEYIQLDPERRHAAAPELPVREGAYAINISPDKLTVYSYDEAGRYYAKQTIIQLLHLHDQGLNAHGDPFPKKYFEAVARSGKLPLGTIIDWPDRAYRGIIDGAQGQAWTHEERKRLLAFCGRNKLNTYIWAPADDPYRRGARALEPYPEETAKQIAELCRLAEKQHVALIWSVDPSGIIDWSKQGGEPDMQRLISKLERMYKLGVRHYSIASTDSESTSLTAEQHTTLSAFITEHFIKKQYDIAPLKPYPSDANPSQALRAAITLLNSSALGDRAILSLLQESSQWVAQALAQGQVYRWNWSCTHQATPLMLGHAHGLTQSAAMERQPAHGFIASPMPQAEASKLGLFATSDYAWNGAAFDPWMNWTEAFQRLYPSSAQALQLLAMRSAPIGKSKACQQSESEQSHEAKSPDTFAPTIGKIRTAIRDQQPIDSQLYLAAEEEFLRMSGAAEQLREDKQLSELRAEIDPWIELFGAIGQLGSSTLRALRALDAHDTSSLGHALATIVEAEQQTRALRAAAPSPQLGCQLLAPFIYELIDSLNAKLTSRYSAESRLWAHPRFSTSAQGASRGARYLHDEDDQSCWTQRGSQQEDGWYMLDYGSPQEIRSVTLTMGGAQPDAIIPRGQMEYSNDATHWQSLGVAGKGAHVYIDCESDPVSARYLRYRILDASTDAQKLAIGTFAINRHRDPQQRRHALTDGDILTTWDVAQAVRPDAPHSISSDSMVHLPVPLGTAKVLIAASSEPPFVFGSQVERGLYLGLRPTSQSTAQLYEYELPAGSTSLSLSSTASQPECLIYEVYFIPAGQAQAPQE